MISEILKYDNEIETKVFNQIQGKLGKPNKTQNIQVNQEVRRLGLGLEVQYNFTSYK